MAYLSDYFAGTVTSSGLVITGTGTGWQTAQFREGDIFIADGWWARVASVDSNTQITIDANGGSIGGALSNAPYRLRYMSDGSRSSAQARQLIDTLGSSGNLEALGGLVGLPDNVIMFTGPGTMTLVPRTSFVTGVAYDVQVNTLSDRAAYNGQPVGFSVLVANVGDGRSAVYSRVGAAGNWTNPAYVTGPSVTLDVTEVDEIPYGEPPDVELTPVTGGYELKFELPRGMMIEPGSTTTLAPNQPANVTFVPITGGYRLDFAIPRGPTGDIDGVTPFWVARLGADTTAAEALTGLGAASTVSVINPADDKVINGCFDVNQRLATATAFNIFAMDRWPLFGFGGSLAMSRQTFGLADSLGSTSNRHYARISVSGQGAANQFAAFHHKIEDVRSYAGQTITVLGWLRRSAGAGDVAFSMAQNFGSGGSPSSEVILNDKLRWTPSGTWEPFAITVDVPSISGKTVGTNGNDHLRLYWWISAGDTVADQASNIGHQAITVDLFGVHIRKGIVPLSGVEFYSPPSIRQTMADCRRFFRRYIDPTRGAALLGAAGINMGYPITFDIPMRANPAVSVDTSSESYANASNGTVTATAEGFRVQWQATGTGSSRWWSMTVNLDEEL